MKNPQQALPLMGKIESISPKIRNKTMVPTLTTTIQHSFGSFGHNSQNSQSNLEKEEWNWRNQPA